MEESSKGLIYFSIYFNLVLAVGDRVCQIVYYCLTNFINDTVRSTCLAFIIILTASNFIMMTLYLISHKEEGLKASTKIKYFFWYILSAEICFAIGAFKSFKSKYSGYSDTFVLTAKVLNALHIMFVSLPQLLIIPIHSSSLNKFEIIDIVSLVFCTFFILWSLGYYLICAFKDEEIEAEFEEIY
jgi:hypothetical protein